MRALSLAAPPTSGSTLGGLGIIPNTVESLMQCKDLKVVLSWWLRRYWRRTRLEIEILGKGTRSCP